MNTDKIEASIKQVLKEDSKREDSFGEYHPSEVTGCELKVTLDKMTRNETVLNSWLFQGSAVHYYLEETGLLDEALHKSGYHMLDTEYEVNTKHQIADDIWLTGTCDIMCHDGDAQTIIDIKYSSIPVESGHGRLYKYFSQANTYAFMFGADEYGLLVINSKSRELLNDIHVLEGNPNEENWEKVTAKARAIHQTLKNAGYDEGHVWAVDDLESADLDFWDEVLEEFDTSRIPSYEKECQYCDHASYCPVKQGKLKKGIGSFRNGAD